MNKLSKLTPNYLELEVSVSLSNQYKQPHAEVVFFPILIMLCVICRFIMILTPGSSIYTI